MEHRRLEHPAERLEQVGGMHHTGLVGVRHKKQVDPTEYGRWLAQDNRYVRCSGQSGRPSLEEAEGEKEDLKEGRKEEVLRTAAAAAAGRKEQTAGRKVDHSAGRVVAGTEAGFQHHGMLRHVRADLVKTGPQDAGDGSRSS